MEHPAATSGTVDDGEAAGPDDRDLSAEKAARRSGMLDRLACMGMDFAEALHKQAFENPEALNEADPADGEQRRSMVEVAAVFARVASGVRQVIALDARLDAMARVREHGIGGGGGVSSRRGVKNPRKALLKRIVEASIENHAESRETYGLLVKLQDRLEDPSLDERLAGEERMADVATAICEELGVQPYLRKFSDGELDYNIQIDRSHWPNLPKLPTGMVGSPGIPSVFEMQERAAGRPWPPKMGHDPP